MRESLPERDYQIKNGPIAGAKSKRHKLVGDVRIGDARRRSADRNGSGSDAEYQRE